MKLEFLKSKGYSIVKSVNGDYWRLMKDGIVMMEDSACEELYDYNTAIDMFYEMVNELNANEDKTLAFDNPVWDAVTDAYRTAAEEAALTNLEEY